MSSMNKKYCYVEVGDKNGEKQGQDVSVRGGNIPRRGYVHPPNSVWGKLLRGKQDT